MHLAVMLKLLCLGILGGLSGMLAPAIAPVIGATVGEVTVMSSLRGGELAGLSGGFAGGATMMLDEFPQNEERNDALEANMQYWLARNSFMVRKTTEFNYQHLFNGGALGGNYTLADYLQVGNFADEFDPTELSRWMYKQQWAMVVDRIWKDDRVYIIQYTADCATQDLYTEGGERVEHARKVCLDSYPGQTFFVYAAPKDPACTNDQTKDKYKDWYRQKDSAVDRIRSVNGGEDFDGAGTKEITWGNIVESSVKDWNSRDQTDDDLLNEMIDSFDKNPGVQFSLPVCKEPSTLARASDGGTRMPVGMPMFCQGQVDTRFLWAQGLPSQQDIDKGDGYQTLLVEGGNDESHGLLDCDYKSSGNDKKMVETCANGESPSHAIPNEPPAPCNGVTIPKDEVYGVTNVVLDRWGCPKRDAAGEMIPLDLDDFASRGWKHDEV